MEACGCEGTVLQPETQWGMQNKFILLLWGLGGRTRHFAGMQLNLWRLGYVEVREKWQKFGRKNSRNKWFWFQWTGSLNVYVVIQDVPFKMQPKLQQYSVQSVATAASHCNKVTARNGVFHVLHPMVISWGPTDKRTGLEMVELVEFGCRQSKAIGGCHRQSPPGGVGAPIVVSCCIRTPSQVMR
jgi:hypothetical protein